MVRAIEHMYLDILRCFGEAAYDYESLTDGIFTPEFALNKLHAGQICPAAYARIAVILERIATRRL